MLDDLVILRWIMQGVGEQAKADNVVDVIYREGEQRELAFNYLFFLGLTVIRNIERSLKSIPD